MPRIHWAVQCHGHRGNGEPCRAWAVRGGYVCKVHGGSLVRTQRAAEVRLAQLAVHRAFDQAWAKWQWQLAEFHANRILVTSEMLGIPVERVSWIDIAVCHAEHGVPPLIDEAPRITDIPIDRRLLPRVLRW